MTTTTPEIDWTDAPAPETTRVEIADRYRLFIDGGWTPSQGRKTFETINPATEEVLSRCDVANARDIDAAVAAARKAFRSWSRLKPVERGKHLYRIARRIQERARELAIIEPMDGGKPIRESRDVDLPLVAQHFFHHAGWCDKLRYAFPGANDPRPIGVCGQVIPWNFPLLMLAWKIAPALACGNTVVLKPAETTPLTALRFAEICEECGLPPGVVNIVTGAGETGRLLVEHPDVDKVAFTGSTEVGKAIAAASAGTGKRLTLELGGKSPNIFFADVMDRDDAFFDKALEGLAMFALNQGEVCTCPSRVLIQESIYDRFIERAIKRVEAITTGNPLDRNTMVGAQVSEAQMEKILSYIDIGRQEGAQCLTGGERSRLSEDLANGFYVKPTMLLGNNKMRIFQEEIFGPVASVMTFKDEDEALEIANDTFYGLGAGVWSRDGTRAYRMGREIEAGRVWTNCYNLYPAHAAFGGYKQSGIGRENHKMALSHYQQTKCLLVSYNPNALGFF